MSREVATQSSHTENMNKILEHLLGTVSAIFRHIMPGVVALGLLQLSRPDWLGWVCLSESTHLVLLGIMAIVVGNLIYVIHKHTVHQCADWFNAGRPRRQDYVTMIADMTSKHYCRFGEGVRGFLDQRNAQIILMSIAGELTIIASFCGSPGSVANDHPWPMRVSGFVVWILSLIAQNLSFRVAKATALQKPEDGANR